MGKVVINSYEDFEKLVGQQIGISDYVELTQERIHLLPMRHWITNGFTWTPNAPKWKARSTAQLPTVT